MAENDAELVVELEIKPRLVEVAADELLWIDESDEGLKIEDVVKLLDELLEGGVEVLPILLPLLEEATVLFDMIEELVGFENEMLGEFKVVEMKVEVVRAAVVEFKVLVGEDESNDEVDDSAEAKVEAAELNMESDEVTFAPIVEVMLEDGTGAAVTVAVTVRVTAVVTV